MGFAKNGLASSQKRNRAPRTPRGGQRPAKRGRGPRNHPVYHCCYTFDCSQAGRCSARSFLIYPPTGAQWPARPGGLWGGFPNPAKLICMGFAKNGLASSQKCKSRGVFPWAWVSALRARGGPAHLPTDLPYTAPNRPTLHLPPLLPTDLPYTAPNRPTLHLPPPLPTDLPYTSHHISQPTHPTPPTTSPKSPTLYRTPTASPRSPTLHLLTDLPYTYPILVSQSLHPQL